MMPAYSAGSNSELHFQLRNAVLAHPHENYLGTGRFHQGKEIAEERVVSRNASRIAKQVPGSLAKKVEIRRKVVTEAGVGLAE
jgi:hypothetical protein